MNANRRKELNKAISALESIKETIDRLTEEEQEAFDNMPESLQESERGTKAEEAISNLTDASCYITDAIDYITTSIEN